MTNQPTQTCGARLPGQPADRPVRCTLPTDHPGIHRNYVDGELMAGWKRRKHPKRTIRIPVGDLKTTREALCAAQTNLGQRAAAGLDLDHVPHWVARIQALIDQIDVHRPLGPDGKHGTLHTPTCGCEDR